MQWKRLALAVALVASAVGCDDSAITAAAGNLDAKAVPDFGRVMIGRQASYELTVRNLGRRPVTIAEIVQDTPALKDFTIDGGSVKQLGGGQSTTVRISFTPGVMGPRAARLILRSDAQNSEMTFDLTGVGILGKADFAPQVLDFGQVGLRSSSTLPVTLTNTSLLDPAAVTFGATAGTDPEAFSTTATGYVEVAPQSTRDVPITFRPWRTGKFNATIPIKPCPSCAEEQITLIGEGIDVTLTATPNPLDFGYQMPAKQAVKTVTITNHGTRPVTLGPATLGKGTSDSYELVAPQMTGIVLHQHEIAVVSVGFTPPDIGPQTGELRVTTDDDGSPVLIIPLLGSGGGPAIKVNPPDILAFPRTALSLSVMKQVSIKNVGLDPGGQNPLILTNFFVRNGTAFGVAGPGTPLPIDVGRTKYLDVTFTPVNEGVSEAELVIESNDPLRPQIVVKLRGSASKLGDCSYEVTPTALDFASVITGSRAKLYFAIKNVGPEECAVANVRLSAATPPVFAMDAMSTRLIAPGDRLLVGVEFAPDGPTNYEGMVEFDVNSKAAPKGQVLLTGGGVPACFAVVPQTLDFGTVGLACEAPSLSIQMTNQCSVPVNVRRTFVGNGTSDAFKVDAAQAGAQTLNPGAQKQVRVTYAPKAEGFDAAPLYVDTSLQGAPYLVSLLGNAVTRLTHTDSYTLPPLQKVDLLWVLDNSGSMSDKQENIARNAARFIGYAVNSGIDFQLAVTTTGTFPYTDGWTQCPGGADGGEAGRFFPVDNSSPRIITNNTPNGVQAFARNVKVGTCHWVESGLDAGRMALSPPLINNQDDPRTAARNDGNGGFIRPDARVYVVYVSDSDDVIKDANNAAVANPEPVQTYINHLLGLKPGRPDMVGVGAVIGMPSSCSGNIDGVGHRYIQLVQALGGVLADVCSNDWTAVIDAIAKDAFKPQMTFPLSQFADNRNIKVTIDGQEIPATDGSGNRNWKYDPTVGQFGAVVFSPQVAPGPNQTVTITYEVPCP
jgi:hypothetical protein